MPATFGSEFTAEGLQAVITSIAADMEAGRPLEAAWSPERLESYLNQAMAGVAGADLGPLAAVPGRAAPSGLTEGRSQPPAAPPGANPPPEPKKRL